MANWSIGGDWKIHEGGHGTEKAFVTSHMWCTKYQEVDLTEFFSEEYLDTAPEIQVSGGGTKKPSYTTQGFQLQFSLHTQDTYLVITMSGDGRC